MPAPIFSPQAREGLPRRDRRDRLALPLDGSMSLDEMDREIIRAALERSSRNATAAARVLGSTRQTLRYRIDKYGLKSDD